MTHTKTFRMFVSSTFEDFEVERELLKSSLFPHIEEFCATKGYSFRAVDLRWGVTELAFKSHSTIDICLNEVDECLKSPGPNFIALVGNRYGWVPLPKRIEIATMELLKNEMDSDDLAIVQGEYILDENQLPSSFIRKEVVELETDSKTLVENDLTLLRLFKKAAREVVQKGLAENSIIEQFSLSATEMEIRRRIDYGLNNEGFFAYLRNFKNSNRISNHINANLDQSETEELKIKVRNYSNSKSIHEVDLQFDKTLSSRIDSFKYFIKSIRPRLEEQINFQIQELEQHTNVSSEVNSQQFHLSNLSESFLGRKRETEKIRAYLKGSSKVPLILSGPSGSGKSALMSHLIAEQQSKGEKVAYCFVGASESTWTIEGVWRFVFEALDISFGSQNEEECVRFELDQNSTDKEKKFATQVHETLSEIDEKTSILIDGLENLMIEEQFLWLPQQLPTNLKIVLSVLSDSQHQEDSRTFTNLRSRKFDSVEIEQFKECSELLEQLLSRESRCLQRDQLNAVTAVLNKLGSPLYIQLAAQRLSHLTSLKSVEQMFDSEELSFPKSVQEFTKSYLIGLTKYRFHDKFLVLYTLAFLRSIPEGLSENELIRIFSIDERLTNQIQGVNPHLREVNELPLIIWSRFFRDIRSLTQTKLHRGQRTIVLSSREITRALDNLGRTQTATKDFIHLVLLLLIKDHQNVTKRNRWIEVLSAAFVSFHLRFNDTELYSYLLSSVIFKCNADTIREFTEHLLNRSSFCRESLRFEEGLLNSNLAHAMTQPFKEISSPLGIEINKRACTELALNLKALGRTKDAIQYEQDAMAFGQALVEMKGPSMKLQVSNSLMNLANSYNQIGRLEESLKLRLEVLELRRDENSIRPQPQSSYELYLALSGVALTYSTMDESNEAYKYMATAIETIRELYDQSPNEYTFDYAKARINFASICHSRDKKNVAISLIRSNLGMIRTKYLDSPSLWADFYFKSLYMYVVYENDESHFEENDKLHFAFDRAHDLIRLFENNRSEWEALTREISIAVLRWCARNERDSKKDLETIVRIEEILTDLDFSSFSMLYIKGLGSLATEYSKEGETDKEIECREKLLALFDKCEEGASKTNYLEEIRNIDSLRSLYNGANRLEKVVSLGLKTKDIMNRQLLDDNVSSQQIYIDTLEQLGTDLREIDRLSEAILIQHEALDYVKILFDKDPNNWIHKRVVSLHNLAVSYQRKEETLDKAIELQTEALAELTPFFKENKGEFIGKYIDATSALANAYGKKTQFLKAIELYKDALDNLTPVLQENKPENLYRYYHIVNNLGANYLKSENSQMALFYLKKGLNSSKKMIMMGLKNSERSHIQALTNLSNLYIPLGLFEKASELQTEATNRLAKLYPLNPNQWSSLFKENKKLGDHITNVKNKFGDRVHKLLSKGVLSIKELYKISQDDWFDDYILALNILSIKISEYSKADTLSFRKEEIRVRETRLESFGSVADTLPSGNFLDYLKNLEWLSYLYSSISDINGNIRTLRLEVRAIVQYPKEAGNKNAGRLPKLISDLGNNYKKIGELDKAISAQNNLVLIRESRYLKEGGCKKEYAESLVDLADSFMIKGKASAANNLNQLNDYDLDPESEPIRPDIFLEDKDSIQKAIGLLAKAGGVLNPLLVENNEVIRKLYVRSRFSLSSAYMILGIPSEALFVCQEALVQSRVLIESNRKHHLLEYCQILHHIGQIRTQDEADIEGNNYLKEAYICANEAVSRSIHGGKLIQATCAIPLAMTYVEWGLLGLAEELHETVQNELKLQPSSEMKDWKSIRILSQVLYQHMDDTKSTFKNQIGRYVSESLQSIESLYKSRPNLWSKEYMHALEILAFEMTRSNPQKAKFYKARQEEVAKEFENTNNQMGLNSE